MPRKPSFSFLQTPYGWKVEIPATLSQSGKRERAFFKTRDKARDFAQNMESKHRALGTNLLAIKPSLAEAALRAEEILIPTGASLVEAAQAYRKKWDAIHSSCAFGPAVAEYLKSRSDLRETTLASYRYTLEKVCAILHSITLSAITSEELNALLLKKGATAARMHRANLAAFWRWAAKSPRGWCQLDALEAVEAPRVSNDSDIKILKPSEVKALLKAAEAEGPAAAAAYAIAIFGGVRMAELEKLTWGDVDEEHIEIGKGTAKTHSRRLVPVCPSLKAWLGATRGDAEDDSPIIPSNWDDISKSVRRRAGWKVAARLLAAKVKAGTLKEMPKASRGAWPINACRHTCASVQVAIGTPLDDLTFKFGHSGGHDLLRKHYVSRMTKKDAIEILSVGPRGTEIKNLNVA
ncbi:MAG: tyrosine-type recombinase/integrase [Verrucomicrobiota bacterium]